MLKIEERCNMHYIKYITKNVSMEFPTEKNVLEENPYITEDCQIKINIPENFIIYEPYDENSLIISEDGEVDFQIRENGQDLYGNTIYSALKNNTQNVQHFVLSDDLKKYHINGRDIIV